jgi:hypothetical protein
MSIYTYKTQKALCEIFNTEYYEDPCLSDQELSKLPEGEYNKPLTGEAAPHYGCRHSKETKEHWSRIRKGIKPPNTGIPMSVEAKLKSSLSHKGKRSSPATEFKSGPRGFSPTKGMKIHTDEYKRKLSEKMKGNRYMIGRKHSLEHKKAISEGNRGKPKPKVSCIKCHKVGGVSSMFQHFLRCF